MIEFEGLRERMTEILVRRGITDRRILDAFRSVPREAFMPPRLAEFAYEDTPLPIGEGQTISQPHVVAMTVDALGLRGGERVLEIGTSSGYAAAILSRLTSEVYTVERVPSLFEEARKRLARLGYENIHILCADGSLGWAEHAPYDAIVVSAGAPRVPRALLDQLAVGGRLVLPVGMRCRPWSLLPETPKRTTGKNRSPKCVSCRSWMWRNEEVHELVEWLRVYGPIHPRSGALRAA